MFDEDIVNFIAIIVYWVRDSSPSETTTSNNKFTTWQRVATHIKRIETRVATH